MVSVGNGNLIKSGLRYSFKVFCGSFEYVGVIIDVLVLDVRVLCSSGCGVFFLVGGLLSVCKLGIVVYGNVGDYNNVILLDFVVYERSSFNDDSLNKEYCKLYRW